jgi:protein-disulfide isomerase
VTTNVYAQGKAGPFPAYGKGPIEVQIYVDYLCPSCSAMESSVDPLLKELVNTA